MWKLLTIFGLFSGLAQAQYLDGPIGLQKKTFREIMPKDVVKLYDQNISELKKLDIAKKALNIGDKIPDFKIMLGGEEHSISEVYEAGPLILKFYHGGWCERCVADLKAYERMNADFKKAGAQILGISPDDDKVSMETRTKNGISYDLIQDADLFAAKELGLTYEASPKVEKHLKDNGLEMAKYLSPTDKKNILVPATYVITKQGVVAFAYVDADYRTKADPKVVLDVVKNLPKKAKK